jgi:hypothetical protein
VSLKIHLFWTFIITKTIQFVVFCDWLPSLGVMLQGSYCDMYQSMLHSFLWLNTLPLFCLPHFVEYTPRRGIAGSFGDSVLLPNSFPTWLYHFMLPSTVCGSSNFSKFTLIFVIVCCFLIIAPFVGAKQNSLWFWFAFP